MTSQESEQPVSHSETDEPQPVSTHFSKVFISYRREDTAAVFIPKLRDSLGARFGKNQIFIDIDNVRLGEDFVQAMKDEVSSCAVFLAMIGRNWLNISSDDGTRRLDNPDDYVRTEIATALIRNKPVIPVLVFGATMPQAQDLPDDLAPLARINACKIDQMHVEQDLERLLKTLEDVFRQQEQAAKEQARQKAVEEAEKQRSEDEARQQAEAEAAEAALRHIEEEVRLLAEQEARGREEEERQQAREKERSRAFEERIQSDLSTLLSQADMAKSKKDWAKVINLLEPLLIHIPNHIEVKHRLDYADEKLKEEKNKAERIAHEGKTAEEEKSRQLHSEVAELEDKAGKEIEPTDQTKEASTEKKAPLACLRLVSAKGLTTILIGGLVLTTAVGIAGWLFYFLGYGSVPRPVVYIPNPPPPSPEPPPSTPIPPTVQVEIRQVTHSPKIKRDQPVGGSNIIIEADGKSPQDKTNVNGYVAFPGIPCGGDIKITAYSSIEKKDFYLKHNLSCAPASICLLIDEARKKLGDCTVNPRYFDSKRRKWTRGSYSNRRRS
jgi:hypothetical protein